MKAIPNLNKEFLNVLVLYENYTNYATSGYIVFVFEEGYIKHKHDIR